MMRRRLLLGATVALTLAPAVQAQSRGARQRDALRLGADPVAEGLAHALLRRFGRETGIAAALDVAPSMALLTAVENGEVDAVLTLAPEAETRLEQAGLLHDRRLLGQVELMLIGPTDGVVRRSKDAVAALRLVSSTGSRFVGRDDGSGLHLAEQALWRAAGLAPKPPWYVLADAGPVDQARAFRGLLLIDRAGWRPDPPRDKRDRFGLLVDADPLLQAPLRLARAYRSKHPAAKLFADWSTSRAGRAVIAAQPGIRPARAEAPAARRDVGN